MQYKLSLVADKKIPNKIAPPIKLKLSFKSAINVDILAIVKLSYLAKI